MKNNKIISVIDEAINAMLKLWGNLDDHPEKQAEVYGAMVILGQWREYLEGKK